MKAGDIAADCRRLQTPEDARGMAVPTLDELTRDPARVGRLTLEEASALLLQLSALGLAVSNRVVAITSNGTAAGEASAIAARSGADRLIDVNEAAKVIGMSATTLYRNKDRYPFFVRNGRAVRFSANGIARWIQRRAGR